MIQRSLFDVGVATPEILKYLRERGAGEGTLARFEGARVEERKIRRYPLSADTLDQYVKRVKSLQAELKESYQDLVAEGYEDEVLPVSATDEVAEDDDSALLSHADEDVPVDMATYRIDESYAGDDKREIPNMNENDGSRVRSSLAKMKKINHTFDPTLFPHDRVSIMGEVKAVPGRGTYHDYAWSRSRKLPIKEVTIDGELTDAAYDTFEGYLKIQVSPQWRPIPSTDPDMRIHSYIAEGYNGTLQFGKDAQGSYYVRGSVSGECRLRYTVSAKKAYFHAQLPDGIYQELNREFPEEVRMVLDKIGLDLAETDVKKVIYKLVEYFRNFKLEGVDVVYGSHYLDACGIGNRAPTGVCRHRAHAFATTAYYLGFRDVRVISNDKHMFVELKVNDRVGWKRIDLGGAPEEMGGASSKGSYQGGSDDLPQPVEYKKAAAMAEALHQYGSGEKPLPERKKAAEKDRGERAYEKPEGESVTAYDSGEESLFDDDVLMDDISRSTLHEMRRGMSASAKKMAALLVTVFGAESETVMYEAEEGTVINPLRNMLKSMVPFDEEIEYAESPELEIGVTFDTSGSIQGYGLVERFEELMTFFSSTFYEAHKGNPKVKWLLSLIGDTYTTIKPFDEKVNDEQLVKRLFTAQKAMGKTGGINAVEAMRGIIDDYKKSKTSKKNKLHFLFTDGEETSGGDFYSLMEAAEAMNIDIVAISLGRQDIRIFDKWIELPRDISIDDLIRVLTQVALLKTVKKRLPKGEELHEYVLGQARIAAQPVETKEKALSKSVVDDARIQKIIHENKERAEAVVVSADTIEAQIKEYPALALLRESTRAYPEREFTVLTGDDPYFYAGWALGHGFTEITDDGSLRDGVALHMNMLRFASQGMYAEVDAERHAALGSYIVNRLLIPHEIADLSAGFHDDDIGRAGRSRPQLAGTRADDFELLREFWAEYVASGTPGAAIMAANQVFLGEEAYAQIMELNGSVRGLEEAERLAIIVPKELYENRLYQEAYKPVLDSFDGKSITVSHVATREEIDSTITMLHNQRRPAVVLTDISGETMRFLREGPLLDGKETIRVLGIDPASTTHYGMFVSILTELLQNTVLHTLPLPNRALTVEQENIFVIDDPLLKGFISESIADQIQERLFALSA